MNTLKELKDVLYDTVYADEVDELECILHHIKTKTIPDMERGLPVDYTGEFVSVTSISTVDVATVLSRNFGIDCNVDIEDIAHDIFSDKLKYIANKMVSDTFMDAYWANMSAVLEYRMADEVRLFTEQLKEQGVEVDE